MDYLQENIDREFRDLAQLADDCVVTTANSTHPALADRHDECLGELSVYTFLHARPFVNSRARLLQELRWLRNAEVEVPINAVSADRFTSSRFSLLSSLIRRFEHPNLVPVVS